MAEKQQDKLETRHVAVTGCKGGTAGTRVQAESQARRERFIKIRERAWSKNEELMHRLAG